MPIAHVVIIGICLLFGFTMLAVLFRFITTIFKWLFIPNKSDQLRSKQISGEAIKSKPLKLAWSSALWLASLLSILAAIGWRISENAPSSPLNNTFTVFAIVFTVVVIGVMYRSIARKRSDNKFDATPLELDPAEPGVGGQLGGRFHLSSQHAHLTLDENTTFHATLICTSIRSRSFSNRKTHRIDWSKQVPIHLSGTADGVEGMFLIDIPDHCSASEDWALSTKIYWHVIIEGNFHTYDLGKFSRTWDINVGEKANQSAMPIPTCFQQKTEKQSNNNARNSALDDFLVSENDQHIHLHSRAGKDAMFKLILMLFGSAFLGAGLFSDESVLARFSFLLVGIVPVLFAAYSFGKSIRVVIDKQSRLVSTQHRWMGFSYSNRAGLLESDNLGIQLSSTSHTGKQPISYYKLKLLSPQGDISLADNIAGEDQAQSLIDFIVEQCAMATPRKLTKDSSVLSAVIMNQ